MSDLKDQVETWRTTDSISEKDRLGDEIPKLIQPIIDARYEIAIKYSIPNDKWNFYGDYRVDSGVITFEDTFANGEVDLRYEDSRGYGGHCNTESIFHIDELENFDADTFEKECIERKRVRLEMNVESAKEDVKRAEDILEKFEKELKEK